MQITASRRSQAPPFSQLWNQLCKKVILRFREKNLISDWILNQELFHSSAEDNFLLGLKQLPYLPLLLLQLDRLIGLMKLALSSLLQIL